METNGEGRNQKPGEPFQTLIRELLNTIAEEGGDSHKMQIATAVSCTPYG